MCFQRQISDVGGGDREREQYLPPKRGEGKKKEPASPSTSRGQKNRKRGKGGRHQFRDQRRGPRARHLDERGEGEGKKGGLSVPPFRRLHQRRRALNEAFRVDEKIPVGLSSKRGRKERSVFRSKTGKKKGRAVACDGKKGGGIDKKKKKKKKKKRRNKKKKKKKKKKRTQKKKKEKDENS